MSLSTETMHTATQAGLSIQMTSERQLPLIRDWVWEALNDPETLAACIPGCESMERSGDDKFQATVMAKVGPVEARFKGKVTVADRNPPQSYRLIFDGSGDGRFCQRVGERAAGRGVLQECFAYWLDEAASRRKTAAVVNSKI